MSTPDHDAFFRAICAAPDDDGPRLVYADWLDEQGDAVLSARAEFIRLQCALAADALPDDARLEARVRARGLYETHRVTWFGAPDRSERAHRCARGFVKQMAAYVSRYSQTDVSLHGLGAIGRLQITIFASSSGLWRAREENALVDVLTQLANRERPIHVCELKLAGCTLDSRLISQMQKGQLANIRSWDLTECHPFAEGVTALVQSPEVARLHSLRLPTIDVGCLRELCASPYLGSLALLDLDRTPFAAESLRALSRSLHLTSLEDLSLFVAPDTSDDGSLWGEFANTPFAPRLTSLALSGATLSQRVMSRLGSSLTGLHRLAIDWDNCEQSVRLADWASISELRELSLRYVSASTAEFGPLLRSRRLSALTHLKMRWSNLPQTQEGVQILLTESAGLPALEHLELDGSYLTPNQLAHLFNSPLANQVSTLHVSASTRGGKRFNLSHPRLDRLRSLSLSGMGIKAAGLAELLASSYVQRLRHLDVSHNRLTDQAITQLSSTPTVQHLETLKLHGNRLTISGVQVLVQSPHLQHLDELTLPRGLGTEAAQLLTDRFGDRLIYE